MTAPARTCPCCGASPFKSKPHCDRCDWRRCLACMAVYDDTTRKTDFQEEA